METLLPRHALPAGPLDPPRAFGRTGPVVLEIGCGHGAATRAYARSHTGHDVIAVDVHVPGIAKMLAAADDEGLDNLWVHRGDGVAFLEHRIAVEQLEAIHLFFPDPWPKLKHAKRRFVSQATLDLIETRLRPGGRLLIATDHGDYAEHAVTELRTHGRYAVMVGDRPSWRPREGFEEKGIRAGRVVTEIRATRGSEPGNARRG